MTTRPPDPDRLEGRPARGGPVIIGRTRLAGPGRLLGLPLLTAILVLVLASSVDAATGWTGPTLVGPAANCYDITAAIDANGKDHVAVDCDGRIRYSTNQSGAWATSFFAVPMPYAEQNPQIAIDGSRIYVAFNRVTYLACGIDYAGVYYRSRLLTSPTWSAATRIGPAGDDLQSLRIVSGKFHLTIYSLLTNSVSYETNAGGTLRRYVISDASGTSSLRVGSDGKARIVYEATSSFGTPCSRGRVSRSRPFRAQRRTIERRRWYSTPAITRMSSGRARPMRAAAVAAPTRAMARTTRRI